MIPGLPAHVMESRPSERSISPPFTRWISRPFTRWISGPFERWISRPLKPWISGLFKPCTSGPGGLLAFALALGLVSVAGRELTHPDELRVAGIARAMVSSGDYALPRLNGEAFLEYPSAGYIPIALLQALAPARAGWGPAGSGPGGYGPQGPGPQGSGPPGSAPGVSGLPGSGPTEWKPPGGGTGGSSPAGWSAREFLTLLAGTLLGAGTVLATFGAGRALGGRRVGLLAGFFLATTAGFFNLQRRCLVDTSLLFWIAVSLQGLAAGVSARWGRNVAGGQSGQSDRSVSGVQSVQGLQGFSGLQRSPGAPGSWGLRVWGLRVVQALWSFRHFAVFYVAAAMAVLSKGLIGAAIPFATAAVFLAVTRDREGLRRARPLLGALLFALPLAAWGLAAARSAGGESLGEIVRQSLWRFASSTADHSAGAHFYVGPVLYLLVPWIAVVPLAWLWLRFGPARDGRRGQEGLLPGREALLPLVWFGVTFLGLSAASAKRNLYLAPIFPAFALLASMTYARISDALPRVRRLEPWAAPVLLVGYAAIHFAILVPSENKTSLRPAFVRVAELLRQGAPETSGSPDKRPQDKTQGSAPPRVVLDRPLAILHRPTVILHRPTEGLRGAAVFYLGRTVPVTETAAELRREIEGRDHAAGALVLAMHRKDEPAFGSEVPPDGLRQVLRHELSSRWAVSVFESQAPAAAKIPEGQDKPEGQEAAKDAQRGPR